MLFKCYDATRTMLLFLCILIINHATIRADLPLSKEYLEPTLTIENGIAVGLNATIGGGLSVGFNAEIGGQSVQSYSRVLSSGYRGISGLYVDESAYIVEKLVVSKRTEQI